MPGSDFRVSGNDFFMSVSHFSMSGNDFPGLVSHFPVWLYDFLQQGFAGFRQWGMVRSIGYPGEHMAYGQPGGE